MLFSWMPNHGRFAAAGQAAAVLFALLFVGAVANAVPEVWTGGTNTGAPEWRWIQRYDFNGNHLGRIPTFNGDEGANIDAMAAVGNRIWTGGRNTGAPEWRWIQRYDFQGNHVDRIPTFNG